jgi:tRNA pseudouridine55 synthase
VEVPRAARTIELFELTLVGVQPAALEIETLCSKGTYIRVLAQDIAAALGSCGHVSALRRLYVEPFAQERMVTLEALAAEPPVLLPADRPLLHLPQVNLTGAQSQAILRGQRVLVGAAAAPRVRIYEAGGRFLGIGEVDAGGALQPRRLFNLPPQ